MPTSISINDLMLMIGEREVTIALLRAEIAALKAELAKKAQEPPNDPADQ